MKTNVSIKPVTTEIELLTEDIGCSRSDANWETSVPNFYTAIWTIPSRGIERKGELSRNKRILPEY